MVEPVRSEGSRVLVDSSEPGPRSGTASGVPQGDPYNIYSQISTNMLYYISYNVIYVIVVCHSKSSGIFYNV